MSKAEGASSETVKVMVRVRPMNRKEQDRGMVYTVDLAIDDRL
jgi:hypothetical protein